MTEQPRSYSTAEVAKLLGVSVPTVQVWADNGDLKAWRTVGGHRRIDAASAESFLAARKRAATEIIPLSPQWKVVVVDDNPVDRELLVEIVQSLLPGCAVRTADNGYEGLITIGLFKPDVVITDIVMPQMDGFAMIQQLCTHSDFKPKVVIAASSLTPERLAKKGTLPEGVPLLAKPFSQEALSELIVGRLKP